MLYVLGEILVWAVAFTVLGLLVGWIVWGWRAPRPPAVTPAASSVQALRNEVTKRDRRMAEIEAELEAAHGRAATLDADLADALRAQSDADGKADTAQRAAVASRDQLAALQSQVAELQDRHAASEDELLELRRTTEAEVEALRAKIDGRDRTISELQIRLAAVDHKPGPPDPDDLKQITGVGRVLEQMLHDAGITTFRQLATLSDGDIAGLDVQLSEFQGRIRREGWVDQARKLHDQKYGSDA